MCNHGCLHPCVLVKLVDSATTLVLPSLWIYLVMFQYCFMSIFTWKLRELPMPLSEDRKILKEELPRLSLDKYYFPLSRLKWVMIEHGISYQLFLSVLDSSLDSLFSGFWIILPRVSTTICKQTESHRKFLRLVPLMVSWTSTLDYFFHSEWMLLCSLVDYEECCCLVLVEGFQTYHQFCRCHCFFFRLMNLFACSWKIH